MTDNFENNLTNDNSEINPDNKVERMLVLGIKTLLESDFAKNISDAVNKLAQSEIEKTTIEKIKANTREKEIDLENNKIELEKVKLETLKVFDIRNKLNDLLFFIISISIFFVSRYFDIIDNKTVLPFLTLIIGFYAKNNWNDIVKLFSKKT